MRRALLFMKLLAFSTAAHADSFTTFTLNMSFSGGGAASGTVSLDITTNSFASVNVQGSGFNDSLFDSSCTSIRSQGLNGNFQLVLTTANDPDNGILIDLPTNSLAGYTGSDVCLAPGGNCYNRSTIVHDNPFMQIAATSGSLTPAGCHHA